MDNRQLETERLFAENLDRLLAGEEIKAGPETGEEVNAALKFAQKIVEITPEPDARFESLLQAKLLTKLAAEEAKESNWFQKLVPRQPVWQAVTATVFVLVVGLIVWLSGAFNPTPVSTALAANAVTDKAVYTAGEPVKIDVALTNTTAKTMTLNQFPPILSLMDAATRQPVYTYNTGTTITKTLAPGETVQFSVSWNQRDVTGNPVAGGNYYIELEDLDSQGQPMKLTLSKPAEFEILSPESSFGNIYKTIELGQSVTSAGITVTLEQLNLTEKGAYLSAFISPPPGYNYRADTDYAAFATYYIDNGWIKYGGLSSYEKSRDGMEHVWYFNEPILPEAQELLIIITNIGEREGPWEFHITPGQ